MMRLRAGVTMNVVQASCCSSPSTPSLGTFIWCGCSPTKQKKKKKKRGRERAREREKKKVISNFSDSVKEEDPATVLTGRE